MAALNLSPAWEGMEARTGADGVAVLTARLSRLNKSLKDGRRAARNGRVVWMQRGAVIELRVHAPTGS